MPNEGAADRDGKPGIAPPRGSRPVCATDKATRNALNHGIYAAAYTAEEKSLAVAVGTLDDEIALARIQLRRILSAMQLSRSEKEVDTAAAPTAAAAGEASTRTPKAKVNPARRRAKRRPDYPALIDRWLGRIAQLERARYQIGRSQGAGAAEIAQEILAALAAINRTVHGPPEANPSAITPSDAPVDAS